MSERVIHIQDAAGQRSEGRECDPTLQPAGASLATSPPDPEHAPDPSLLAAREAEIAEWNRQVRQRMRRQTRRSFLIGGAAALGAVGGWRWLASRRQVSGIPWPLRQGLQLNQQWAQDVLPPQRLSPELRGKAPLGDRLNGDLGLDDPIDLKAWRLSVSGLASQDDPVELTLDALKKLPRKEMTAEFKCIEGWSLVVAWAGVRFTDFMTACPPDTLSGAALDLRRRPDDLQPYVAMETPDGGYYVGLDIETMLHPQTLLAYEMNGAPLTSAHGAPLRLITTVKYGVKSIKRIGTIRYTTSRPGDYWAEQGYDWYLGL